MNMNIEEMSFIPAIYNGHGFRSYINEVGETWFVAKDVCDILEIDNVTMALKKIPAKHLALNRIEGKRGGYDVNMISEPGLYRLILRSDKPEAEPFMEWVTSELLPKLKRTGVYHTPKYLKEKEAETLNSFTRFFSEHGLPIKCIPMNVPSFKPVKRDGDSVRPPRFSKNITED